jgi:hypothetical protein
MQTGKLAIGCSIHGVDAKSLTPGQMLKLKDFLYKNRLIVLKDQSLNEQEYCDFAHRVGSPVPTSRTTTTTPNKSGRGFGSLCGGLGLHLAGAERHAVLQGDAVHHGLLLRS